MRRANRLWEQLSQAADLPDEVFPGQTLIEIVDDHRVLIEGHRGVREYGRDMICVNVSFGTVRICGTGLYLRCMSRYRLVICGHIRSVDFSGTERA